MRIWLIDHYAVPEKYYPLIRQKLFAKYLLRMGHEVIILAASTVHNSSVNLVPEGELYREIKDDGIDYVLIRCRDYQGNGKNRVLNMLEFARKLPMVCDKLDKPDAIVSTSMTPFACAQGIRIAKKYKCKKIAQISDLYPETLVAYDYLRASNPIIKVLRKLEKWIYKNADDVVFTMEGAYDYIIEQRWEKEIPRRKVHYINNGVDLEEYKKNKNEYIIHDENLERNDTYKIIYVGSIRRVNNLGALLDSAKLLRNEKVLFLIWGDGDERKELEKRIVDERINNVVFKGKVEKKYIPYIVSCADLNFLHYDQSPVLRFGMSMNKLFDYIAAEKPIMTDIYSKYNPIVEYHVGIQIENSKPENVAKEILKFMNMTELEKKRISENCVIASNEFDFKNLTRKLVSIIERNDS